MLKIKCEDSIIKNIQIPSNPIYTSRWENGQEVEIIFLSEVPEGHIKIQDDLLTVDENGEYQLVPAFRVVEDVEMDDDSDFYENIA